MKGSGSGSGRREKREESTEQKEEREKERDGNTATKVSETDVENDEQAIIGARKSEGRERVVGLYFDYASEAGT